VKTLLILFYGTKLVLKAVYILKTQNKNKIFTIWSFYSLFFKTLNETSNYSYRKYNFLKMTVFKTGDRLKTEL